MSDPVSYQPVPYAIPDYKPQVLTWFKVYAIGMAILYVAVAVAGVWFVVAADQLGSGARDETEVRVQGWIMLGMGIPFAAAFAAAPLLPRRTWVWIYDIVLIAFGLTSCCLWPATIPLLIFWIKPEVRAWFGNAT